MKAKTQKNIYPVRESHRQSRTKFSNGVYITLALMLGVLFVAKFGGPSILRLYIESGIGTCRKIPILCMAPQGEITGTDINKVYLAELLPYEFPKMAISAPKGFSVVQETIKKVYYKKKKPKQNRDIIYVLYEEPDFFVNLFPQLKKQGIIDDYEFLRRTMYAKLKGIKNLTDAFFVIMKGIFIPDLGDQNNVKMAQFNLAGKRGFINYNLSDSGNYFDCNIFNEQGDFFKVYIKDKSALLDLDKALAIISSVKRQDDIRA